MTAHDCRTHDPDCFRCDLSLNEIAEPTECQDEYYVNPPGANAVCDLHLHHPGPHQGEDPSGSPWTWWTWSYHYSAATPRQGVSE